MSECGKRIYNETFFSATFYQLGCYQFLVRNKFKNFLKEFMCDSTKFKNQKLRLELKPDLFNRGVKSSCA